MNGRPWPGSLQYAAAVQSPASAFNSPQLRLATFIADQLGPKSVEGQRAVVFFADTSGGPIAVRCLKTPVPSGAERYAALRAYLAEHPVTAMTRADWIEDGIRIAGTPWPVVTMDQVTGLSLRNFVRSHLHDPARLTQVAADWRALITQLSLANIAHGDLQQDNVMLAEEEQLRLIDLDAVWIPTLTHLPPPPERGHRHFQHPERTHRGYWGRYVDTFPALVIYLSLRALAADPQLFDDFNNDENLIFCDEDFVYPGETALWARLWASPDVDLRSLVSVLERYCRTSVKMDADLDRLLTPGGFPETAPSWVSPGLREVREAWWSSLPPSAANSGPEPPAATVPGGATAQEWWHREPAASARPGWASSAPPGATAGSVPPVMSPGSPQPTGRPGPSTARPSTPRRPAARRQARPVRQAAVTLAVIAALLLLVLVIALAVAR